MFRRLTLAALTAVALPALAAHEEHGHEEAPKAASKPVAKALAKAAEPAAVEAAQTSTPTIPATVKEQVQRLIDGNRRYVEGRMLNIERDAARRNEIAKAQHPFAIVLTCSDSRVPPELLFDQGLGELFVIRTAGNVVDDVAIGSIEYAAEHLHAKLLVVLGHEYCGAVKATLAGGEAPGHIGSIVEKIKPSVAIGKAFPGDALDNCVRANIVNITSQLRENKPMLSEMVKSGELTVMGARYDLDDGKVSWMP